MTAPREVLTREEAADYLNVSVDFLDKLRADGEIAETWMRRRPGANRGGVLRFRKTVLDRYLDRKTRVAK